MKSVLKWTVIFAWVPASCWLVALMVRFLWGLFVVPAFEMAALSPRNAFGLAVMVAYLSPHRETESDRQYGDRWWWSIANALGRTAIILVSVGIAVLVLP